MATCPICGKKFKPCTMHVKDEFNWRAVACSWECGDAYVRKIRESRVSRREQNTLLGVSPETQVEHGLD